MVNVQFLRIVSLITALGFILSSCGVVRPGSPITPDRPIESALIQSGVASWYGPDFHGRATANGERYNMHDLTAAHRTLPFNTLVRVVNENNGKSVDVRINDRGPYVGNRIIDLSRAAASEIDMIDTGVVNVRIYLIGEGDRPVNQSQVSNSESFTVQLASFNTRVLAENEARKIDGSRVEAVSVAGVTAYRLYYGTFRIRDEAEEALRKLEEHGHNGFVKQIEN